MTASANVAGCVDMLTTMHSPALLDGSIVLRIYLLAWF
jgi:hypothetical protein